MAEDDEDIEDDIDDESIIDDDSIIDDELFCAKPGTTAEATEPAEKLQNALSRRRISLNP